METFMIFMSRQNTSKNPSNPHEKPYKNHQKKKVAPFRRQVAAPGMKSNVTVASTGWKGGSAMRPGAEGSGFSPKAKVPGMRSLRTPPVFMPAMPS